MRVFAQEYEGRRWHHAVVEFVLSGRKDPVHLQLRPRRATWVAYQVREGGTLGNGRVFFDATPWPKDKKGAPDGMKVGRAGNIFAAGPSGIRVFAPDGTHLGGVETRVATSNCAWGGERFHPLYHGRNGRLSNRAADKGS